MPQFTQTEWIDKKLTSVLTVGSATIDFIFQVDSIPLTAQKHRARDATITIGGCAANAAATIARLGGISLLASNIGDDKLGDLIHDELAHFGIDARLVHRNKGGRSSCSTILVSPDGERLVLNYRGSDLCRDAARLKSAPKVGAILVDSRWAEGAAVALNMASERRIPGIIDIEAGVEPALLNKATHLAFSAQGLCSVYPGFSLKDALKKAAVEHHCWACVTNGARGVLYMDEGQICHIGTPEVTSVDSLGAGDVWHGAFALLLAEGTNEKAAIKFANAAAALKCTKSSGRGAIPDRRAINEFILETENAANAR